MKGIGPRILLMGGNYRALCVLERLLDRGERVVAFIGEEGAGERDFCPEILEACDRAAIPARSGRKLGEEIVRWLEDRIRPDLVISIGLRSEVPLAIGGNCRLGLIEVIDSIGGGQPSVALRQSGQEILSGELPCLVEDDDTAGDLFLQLAETTLSLLDQYLDQVCDRHARPVVSVPYEPTPSEEACFVAGSPAEPGRHTVEIERAVGSYTGSDHVVALSSATEAAHLLLSTLDLPPGEEILFPGIVSHAFLTAARQCGLRPHFVDIDPRTLTVDPERMADLISPRTRALVITHTLGQPADLDAVRSIAAARDLPVIEDGAGALGARHGEQRLGANPSSSVLTLPPTSLTSSSKAAFVTARPDLAEDLMQRCEKLRLSDAEAVTALRHFERLEDELSARRRHATAYSSELVRYDAFNVPTTPEGRLPTYAAYPLRITSFSRTCAEDLCRLLTECGVETRMIATVGSDRELSEVPLAERIRTSTLLLPVSSALSDELRGVVLDSIFDYAIG